MSVDKDYFNTLNKIESILNKENAENLDKMLDNIYNIKPIRLKWFLLKAKTLKLLNKDTFKIKDILFKKYLFLFDNDKLEEIANCLMELTEDEIEKERYLYHIALKCNDNNIINQKQNEYNLLIEKYINDNISQNEFEQLISNCYIRMDFTQYVILKTVYEKLYNIIIETPEWVLNMPNVKIDIERLKESRNKTFIVIEDENDTFCCQSVIKSLSFFEHNIFYLDKALVVELNNEVDISETVSISLENAIQYSNCIVIHPVKLSYNDNLCADNTDYLVDYINNNLAKNKLSTIYCNGFVTDRLCRSGLLQKSTERMSIFKAKYLEGNLNISLSGDYLSYISELYKYDVHKSIDIEPEFDFSIVIPISNNINTFQYTLQTCLNIEYDGSYEIVVSDNSINGNTIVYDYIKKINDNRIKYYKTPRALPLAKSFEFAFLQTKGKFLFSIGADDGVLPWSLNVLKNVLEQIPNNEIFLWDRGFYAWPGFNDGQQNQFIIPKPYIKNKIDVDFISSAEMLLNVIDNPSSMYGLPLLYINSGFRRSYLKTILKKSGRLWDGRGQDLYMGVLNVCINSEIVRINYPLTIAGMSSGSIGAICQKSINSIIFPQKAYLNLSTCSVYEFLIPLFSGDISDLYSAILRLASRGILSEVFINKTFSNVKLYENQMSLLSKNDELYEECICSIVECLSNKKDFLLKWYDKLFLPIKNVNNNDTINRRYYDVGFNANGGLTLDASTFDVKNIYEATKLFEKIIGI